MKYTLQSIKNVAHVCVRLKNLKQYTILMKRSWNDTEAEYI